MFVPVVYVLCECPEHGIVHAKRTGEYVGGSTTPLYSYECPGVEGNTGAVTSPSRRDTRFASVQPGLSA
jgi:hypothetical protein